MNDGKNRKHLSSKIFLSSKKDYSWLLDTQKTRREADYLMLK